MAKTFDIQLPGQQKYAGCRFQTSRYLNNGNLALMIVNDEYGRLYTCTVNPGEKLEDDVICVKDYTENRGMADWLKRQGLIGDRVMTIPSGWVELGVYELTGPGKELFREQAE